MKKRGLTEAEATNLIEYLETLKEYHSDILLLLMLSGIRTHELWGLRVCDLDFDNDTLTVWDAAKDSNGRVVGLPKWCTSRVRGKVLGSGMPAEGRLVFALGYESKGGDVETFKAVLRRDWQVIKRRVFGGKLRLGLHSLRHTFALKVYSITKNPLAVQNLLGHKSFASTQKYLLYADEPLQIAASREIYQDKKKVS